MTGSGSDDELPPAPTLRREGNVIPTNTSVNRDEVVAQRAARIAAAATLERGSSTITSGTPSSRLGTATPAQSRGPSQD